MSQWKNLFKNVRIIILIVFLILAFFAIAPRPFNTGVAIKSVIKDSAAFDAGFISPKPNTLPTAFERIHSIDGTEIKDVIDYYKFMEGVTYNQTLFIETNKDEYYVTTKPKYEYIITDEIVNVTKTVMIPKNVTINGTNTTVMTPVNQTTQENKTIANLLGMEPIGLFVEDAPKSNIRLGLDLQGGTRVLLQPEVPLSNDDMEIVRTSMEQRLNVYGLANVIPRMVLDKPRALGGKPKYISVEIAGANIQEVKELLGKQGKFEAKIGDKTVFVGGTDIKYVCRSPECSGPDPRNPPSQMENGTWATRFYFSISITPEAAKRQSDATKDLTVITTDANGNPLPLNQQYLNSTIDLYLDNKLIDSLNIGKGLQGNPVTDIQISGSGFGIRRDQSFIHAMENMKNLQTVLITGSLPVKMNIVKADNVSPILGKEFAKNALIVGLLAILMVIVVVYIIYREIKISIPMIITMMSEVILLLGMASLARWDLDLAAVAGIIIAVGTGVDDQIVITDEVLSGLKGEVLITWKERIKRAFFIVMNSYFTTVVAMVPLLFAGAGLIKGFALTTITGVTFGVFITRQAFAAMIEFFLNK